LKLVSSYLLLTISTSFREKSTKTRIETDETEYKGKARCQVLEKNPPKQGLKHTIIQGWGKKPKSFREKSTKTRIETLKRKVR